MPVQDPHRRGPKKRANMVRKWWNFHEITCRQLKELVVETKQQMPLMELNLNEVVMISYLVAKAWHELDNEIYDAASYFQSFDPPEDEYGEQPADEQVAN